jgi:hypothetical protein
MFDPQNGSRYPFPSSAEHYRRFHGEVAWLYNPWSGVKRHPKDIATDLQGLLIREPAVVV